MSEPFVYRVIEVVRVIDGDSYEVILDLGFNARLHVRTRLLGADTFEMRGGTEETKRLAEDGRQHAIAWFSEMTGRVLCRTVHVDSFGRWLAEFFVPGLAHLAQELSDLGLTTGRYE